MRTHPAKIKRLHSEHDPVSPPLSGQPRYAHSFAPPGSGLQMNAKQYVDWRRLNYPFVSPRQRLCCDVDPDHEVKHVGSLNFWNEAIRTNHARLDRINERLCAQLIGFALCYVEVAAVQIAARLQVGLATPQEILAGLDTIAQAQSSVVGHDIWRYAKCVEHPVVGAAVFNAIHNSWGAPRNARAQPYPPPEDPFVTVQLPDEVARVAVPLPSQHDAARHQRHEFPPGEGWPRRPGQRRKKSLAAPSVPPPPTPCAPPPLAADAPPLTTQARPPDSLVPTAVDPGRFLEAVRAAFEVGASYANPHAKVFSALAERLKEPTSTRLPDPFAPALRVLADTLYGPSRAYWEEATRVFRGRYAAADAQPGEAEAAVRRWQALVRLPAESNAALREWAQAESSSQGYHCATALVLSAARAPLRSVGTQAPEEGEDCAFMTGTLFLETSLARPKPVGEGATAKALWSGLFDRRLAASRQAPSALTQRFLSFLVVLAGEASAVASETYQVWADELAEWAQLDPAPVRAAFARSEAGRAPAHELLGRGVTLPDCRWSDYPDPPWLELPWLAAPPRSGEHDGCWWQEVTLSRELLPYLRRLSMCLDGLLLAEVHVAQYASPSH